MDFLGLTGGLAFPDTVYFESYDTLSGVANRL